MINIKILKLASDTKYLGLTNKYTHKITAKNKTCGDKIKLEIIVGEDESLLDKKKKTIGFVAEGVKKKRKYTKRKKKK